MKKFLMIAFLAGLLTELSWQKSFHLGSSCLQKENCTLEATRLAQSLNNYIKIEIQTNQSVLCDLCENALPFVKELIIANETKSFRAIATAVCVVLNITQESICYQAVGLFEVYLYTCIIC